MLILSSSFRSAHPTLSPHVPSLLNPQEDFAQAAEAIRPIEGVSWDDMLEMYGLFKQAKMGDNDTGGLACEGWGAAGEQQGRCISCVWRW